MRKLFKCTLRQRLSLGCFCNTQKSSPRAWKVFKIIWKLCRKYLRRYGENDKRILRYSPNMPRDIKLTKTKNFRSYCRSTALIGSNGQKTISRYCSIRSTGVRFYKKKFIYFNIGLEKLLKNSRTSCVPYLGLDLLNFVNIFEIHLVTQSFLNFQCTRRHWSCFFWHQNIRHQIKNEFCLC